MAYDTTQVTIGDYTKASDANRGFDSIDYLQGLADAGHDFHTSMGDGHHWANFDAPTYFKDTAEDDWIAVWIDDTAAENVLRYKSGATKVAATPSSKTDGASFSQPDMYLAAPWKINVGSGVTWTVGWWQAADSSWWLLVNTADVSSFARGDAEFYIPLGDIGDVPAT